MYMSKPLFSYKKHLRTNWFLTILVIIGIAGYSDYNSPQNFRESTTLLVLDQKNKSNTATFNFFAHINRSSFFIFCCTNTIQFLSKKHQSNALRTHKKYTDFIFLDTLKKIFLHNIHNSSRKDFFHISFLS